MIANTKRSVEYAASGLRGPAGAVRHDDEAWMSAGRVAAVGLSGGGAMSSSRHPGGELVQMVTETVRLILVELNLAARVQRHATPQLVRAWMIAGLYDLYGGTPQWADLLAALGLKRSTARCLVRIGNHQPFRGAWQDVLPHDLYALYLLTRLDEDAFWELIFWRGHELDEIPMTRGEVREWVQQLRRPGMEQFGREVPE